MGFLYLSFHTNNINEGKGVLLFDCTPTHRDCLVGRSSHGGGHTSLSLSFHGGGHPSLSLSSHGGGHTSLSVSPPQSRLLFISSLARRACTARFICSDSFLHVFVLFSHSPLASTPKRRLVVNAGTGWGAHQPDLRPWALARSRAARAISLASAVLILLGVMRWGRTTPLACWNLSTRFMSSMRSEPWESRDRGVRV